MIIDGYGIHAFVGLNEFSVEDSTEKLPSLNKYSTQYRNSKHLTDFY